MTSGLVDYASCTASRHCIVAVQSRPPDLVGTALNLGDVGSLHPQALRYQVALVPSEMFEGLHRIL